MSASLSNLSTRHAIETLGLELAANEPLKSDLSTEVLLRTAELLTRSVVSAETLTESAHVMSKQIDDAREELETKMMRLVADSRKEPRLPVNIRMTPRTRPTGERFTYLSWRAPGDAARPVNPHELMVGASMSQMLKFDELRARFEQLVMNHNVLSYLRMALLANNNTSVAR